mmetsp:Transcript_76226/g.218408  ORF Transcript_76226/g.218408 Transcript_76226/m.218408 type:complete len:270 (-) Transcript_76226:227-1036(-)
MGYDAAPRKGLHARAVGLGHPSRSRLEHVWRTVHCLARSGGPLPHWCFRAIVVRDAGCQLALQLGPIVVQDGGQGARGTVVHELGGHSVRPLRLAHGISAGLLLHWYHHIMLRRTDHHHLRHVFEPVRLQDGGGCHDQEHLGCRKLGRAKRARAGRLKPWLLPSLMPKTCVCSTEDGVCRGRENFASRRQEPPRCSLASRFMPSVFGFNIQACVTTEQELVEGGLGGQLAWKARSASLGSVIRCLAPELVRPPCHGSAGQNACFVQQSR